MADINNEFHHRLYSKKYAYITDTIVKYSPNGYDRNGCYKKRMSGHQSLMSMKSRAC